MNMEVSYENDLLLKTVQAFLETKSIPMRKWWTACEVL